MSGLECCVNLVDLNLSGNSIAKCVRGGGCWGGGASQRRFGRMGLLVQALISHQSSPAPLATQAHGLMPGC